MGSEMCIRDSTGTDSLESAVFLDPIDAPIDTPPFQGIPASHDEANEVCRAIIKDLLSKVGNLVPIGKMKIHGSFRRVPEPSKVFCAPCLQNGREYYHNTIECHVYPINRMTPHYFDWLLKNVNLCVSCTAAEVQPHHSFCDNPNNTKKVSKSACRPYAGPVLCNESQVSDRCSTCVSTEGFTAKRCGQCLSAVYCSVGCQKRDWKLHKQICRLITKSGRARA